MLQMPKRSLCDLVLDTIDIISARKNRPNLVRIYRHLHRLYDLSLSTCEALLQSLLKEGRVIRVTYKGNISYRNALKWKKYSYYMKKTMGSELPGTILTKAISELVVQEPDYLNMGVPCKILEEHLLSMTDDNINKETIHKLLQRELKHESLLQLDNGNYFLGPKPPEASLFDGEEVDFKFDKVKKVKTYKHDIKRLKDKNNDSITLSSLVLPNNNDLELNKEFPDSEEIVQSNVTADIRVIKNGGLDRLMEFDETCSNDTSQCPTAKEDKCKSTNFKNKEHSKHGDCETYAVNNGNFSVNEKVVINDSAVSLVEEELNGEFHVRALEELISTESGSSQVLDSEDSVSNLDDNNCSVEKLSSCSPVQEEKCQESSDDSFSLNISDSDININSSLENTISNDGNSNKHESLAIEEYKSSNVLHSDDGLSKEGNSIPKNKSSSLKADSGLAKPKNCISEEKATRKVKKIQPVERVQRKKRTKYDASDYYFPSLKRKTRDSTSDNDKKEDKRRKKKKKDNGGGCLSGIFAKRVMFPGNTSMCCECNCYISKVKLDPMIFCTTCANQGHQSCALKTMNGKNWFCVGCRSDAVSPKCAICHKLADADDKGVLHGCTRCGEHYHKDCHKLSIQFPFSDDWYCFKCSLEEKSSKEMNGSPEKKEVPEVNTKSSVFETENKTNNNFQFLKEEPPDSRNWSADDVFNYFKEYLDAETAQAFMEQDIDGYALKLMGRSDVFNLGLKLGPSLKVLFHVRRLQLRSNSLMKIWSN